MNAYKNGDVSALLLELCHRSMFDLLKEAYLIPKRFHGKAGENPILLTDADGKLLADKRISYQNMNIKIPRNLPCSRCSPTLEIIFG